MDEWFGLGSWWYFDDFFHINRRHSYRWVAAVFRLNYLILACELKTHDQKICVYRDLHHWRSNQRPQIAEPRLYHCHQYISHTSNAKLTNHGYCAANKKNSETRWRYRWSKASDKYTSSSRIQSAYPGASREGIHLYGKVNKTVHVF